MKRTIPTLLLAALIPFGWPPTVATHQPNILFTMSNDHATHAIGSARVDGYARVIRSR